MNGQQNAQKIHAAKDQQAGSIAVRQLKYQPAEGTDEGVPLQVPSRFMVQATTTAFRPANSIRNERQEGGLPAR